MHTLSRLLETGGERDKDDVGSVYVLTVMAMENVRKAKDAQERMHRLIVGREASAPDPSIPATGRFNTLWRNCVANDVDTDGNAVWKAAMDAAEANLADAVPTSILGAVAMLGIATAVVSTPVVATAGERKTVADRISDFLAARRALDVAVDAHSDTAYDMPVWPTFEDAEHALISHPCANEDDRRMKVIFALSDRHFLDTIETNTCDGVPVLVDFLRSLI